MTRRRGSEHPADKRIPEQKKALANYYRDEVDSGAANLRKPIKDHAKKEPLYPATKAAVLAERKKVS
jgi:hypothetical protein